MFFILAQRQFEEHSWKQQVVRWFAVQVIIQGMREIGVFQDVVENGQRVIEESALQIGNQNKSYPPTPMGDFSLDEIQEVEKIYDSLSSGRQVPSGKDEWLYHSVLSPVNNFLSPLTGHSILWVNSATLNGISEPRVNIYDKRY